MSERNLVVHQASLTSIEIAMANATAQIARQIDDLLRQVDLLTPGWETSSESHAANVEHQQKLRDGLERLTNALDEVRSKVAAYREDAREVEVENVAIVN